MSVPIAECQALGHVEGRYGGDRSCIGRDEYSKGQDNANSSFLKQSLSVDKGTTVHIYWGPSTGVRQPEERLSQGII